MSQGHGGKAHGRNMKNVYFFLLKVKEKLRRPGTPQCRLAGRLGRKADLNWKLKTSNTSRKTGRCDLV